MIAFFRDLFDTSGFPARWHRGQWSDTHGWLHILSDIAIFGAYAAIPLVLAYFIRRRKDVPFRPIYWLFGAFILSCGLTHLIEATIFWHPWYRLSGLMKAVTAVVSWITVIALIKVIPSALTLPGLEKVNRQLSKEIAECQKAEEAFQVSGERLKLAAEAGGVGIWDWNLVNNTLVWDDAMFSLYGGRREDFSGAYAAWVALLHPEDRAASEAASQDAVAGRKDYPIEFRVIWPDGSVHHLEAHGRVFRDEAGQPVRMVGTNVDITARKLRERALVFLADLQKVFAPLTSSTEIMRAASERLAEHLGLRHCTLVEVDEAADTCTVLHDHNAPGTRNLAGDYRLSDFLPEEERRLLASGAPLVIANVRDGGRTAVRAEHFEAPGTRAVLNAGYVSGGRWRFMLHASRAEPYAWPAEEVELLTELAARIYLRVDRARAEEALRESNILLDTLLTRAPIGFCMLDRELRYVRINDQLAEINGIPAAAHLGRTVAEILPGLDASVRAVTKRILQTGEAVRNHEFSGETAAETGVTRYWNESWYPVRDREGEIIGFGGVVEEITARKESEESVARLVAIVESSHDALFGEDLDGIITSWNRGAEQIFGYRAEEIVGTSIMRLIPADRQAAEHEVQRQIVAGELGGTFETIRLTKEGREFPASVTIATMKNVAGKVIGTSRVLRDITERKRAEEALRENAAVFSTLIEQAPMGTYVVDAQFRMRQVNAEAMAVFASVQPLIGRDFQEVLEILWGPDVGGQIAGIFRHTLATGERYISPPFTEQRHDLGIEQTYEWETQRVILPDGQHGVVCYFHEVTERARTTAALRASQERMRLAAEATGVGIWEWNVVTNAIRWDALMFRIYGIGPTPDGFVQYQDWRGAVLPEDLAENEAILQDTVRRCGHSTREFRIRRRSDGECRNIQAVETVRKNAAGQTEWVVGTNLDVTERKRAEKAVLAAGERFRFMAEAMPQKICTTKPDGALNYLNARWHEFLGPTLEKLQKLGWPAVIHPDDVEETLRCWQACLDSGKNLELEHRVRNHEGEYRWHLTRSQPLRDGDGKITLWISTSTDIDDMMQAQEELIEAEQQLANRAVLLEALVAERTVNLSSANAKLLVEAEERKRLETEIAYAVEKERARLGQELHDGLVQEMVGVGMMLHVLERQMKKPAPEFSTEAGRLGMMIEKAQENARNLAKNFFPVELEQYGLHVALEGIAQRAQAQHGIRCTVETDEHSTAKLRGAHAVQLFRIAQEAVQNAGKHSKASHIVISLRKQNGAWLLTVKDDGIGLPANAQPTKGMGQRILQYRARIIQGTLTVRNNPDRGVTVACSAPSTSPGESDAEEQATLRL